MRNKTINLLTLALFAGIFTFAILTNKNCAANIKRHITTKIEQISNK